MAVTRTPGTTAPVESFTVPVMMPRSPCASSPAAVKTKTVTITQIFFISKPHCSVWTCRSWLSWLIDDTAPQPGVFQAHDFLLESVYTRQPFKPYHASNSRRVRWLSSRSNQAQLWLAPCVVEPHQSPGKTHAFRSHRRRGFVVPVYIGGRLPLRSAIRFRS